MAVVTRFAPSPTGALHIGGARTALFNWAFARRHGGRFLLRFEDTDRARSTVESEREILDGLEWLGLDHDPVPGPEAIPHQSRRADRYQEAVDSLLASGHAYRCDCTAVQVEAMRTRARAEGRNPGYDGTCRDRNLSPRPGVSHCVRLRIDDAGPTRWNDEIAGPSGQDAAQLDDFVLARSDGTPVYHLAVVVDDHEMGVTHVIRGREHMTSTPRQLLLYAGLGWTPPAFAHVPLLVEPSGKKLSKRHAGVSVESFKERGFPAEAVVNYLARLGWGHGDLEIVDAETLAGLFDLSDVGKSPSSVQDDKLLWLSQHYLKTLPSDRLLSDLAPFLEAEVGRPVPIDGALAELIDLLRERSRTLVEMAEKARFGVVDGIEIDEKAARKHLKPERLPALRSLRDALAAAEEWNDGTLESVFETVSQAHDLKLGGLAQPMRVAVTGRAESPGIFETLRVVGRERTLERLDRVLARMSAGPDQD